MNDILKWHLRPNNTYIYIKLRYLRICYFNTSVNTVQTVETREEEITYAEPAFYKRKAQKAVRSFIHFKCCVSVSFHQGVRFACACFCHLLTRGIGDISCVN